MHNIEIGSRNSPTVALRSPLWLLSLLVLLLGSISLALSAQAQVQESNFKDDEGAIAMWTDDGLRLTISKSDGWVSAVAVDGKSHPMKTSPVVRFEEVVEIPNAKNLIGKWDKAAWGVPDKPVNDPWLNVPGSAPKKPTKTLTLNQTRPTPLILSGYCKYEDNGTEEGWMTRWLAINANCKYVDGDTMPEVSSYYGGYNHGSQFNSKVICPDKPISSIDIELNSAGEKNIAWYKDVSLKSAKYVIASPKGAFEHQDTVAVQSFDVKESSLIGRLTYQPGKSCIIVRCYFESTNKTDRAISAYLAIPLDAVGGIWYDDARQSRMIEAGKIYRNSAWYGAGRSGNYAQYPIAAITTRDGLSLAIGAVLDEPRVFEMEYDAGSKELRVRYDLGLSPDSGKWANRGSFTTQLFTFNTKDGFRGATEKYHSINSWAFVKRVQREGNWLAFLTPAQIPGGCEDFGFQFVEAVNNIGWEDRQGMYSLKYSSPWIHVHNVPSSMQLEELAGPIDPKASFKTTERILNDRGPTNPPEFIDRHLAYSGGYIEDNWGYPQGYFFRHPARKENFMIMNPNPDLPAPPGSPFSQGRLEQEYLTESMQPWKQWSVPGWLSWRTSERPTVEVDSQQAASGGKSIRFDPIRSRNPYEQYLRGFSQSFYYADGNDSSFEFSFMAKGLSVPANGTTAKWTLDFMSEEDKTDSHTFALDDLGSEWKRYSFKIKPSLKTEAIILLFGTNPKTPEYSTLWLDDISLTVEGSKANILTNGDLEQAELLGGEVDGVYLDIMDCYTNNLNYRRSHWPYAEEPLTFDTARKPALQQQFSHVTFAKKTAEWLRLRGKIQFANCVPGTVFSAPYLDAMGTEDNWSIGGGYKPRSDAGLNYYKFMSAQKPYCLLNYSCFDVADQEKYVKRCLFYGVYPGLICTTPAGKWYWTDPIYVRRNRPIYAKYMPIILEIAKAGWRPVTLADSDNKSIWLERYGDGDTVYIAAFNPTSEEQTAKIAIDSRAGMSPTSNLTEITGGSDMSITKNGEKLLFNATIGPEDVRVFKISR